MASNSKNYFMSGITEMLILSMLKDKDRYVYEIVKGIEKFSEGKLAISQNTIYTSAYKLEKEGKIREYSVIVKKKRTRVYYNIEEEGLRSLEEQIKIFDCTVDGVKKVLNALEEVGTDENEG